MTDLEIAKTNLKDDKTLVLVKDGKIIDSTLDGIKPLINMLNDKIDLCGYSLADKIVGKAQAMLLVKAGIVNVHAQVLSINGEAILKKYNINYTYDVLTNEIINRKKTDICPMEKALIGIDDIDKAYEVLKEKVLTI